MIAAGALPEIGIVMGLPQETAAGASRDFVARGLRMTAAGAMTMTVVGLPRKTAAGADRDSAWQLHPAIAAGVHNGFFFV